MAAWETAASPGTNLALSTAWDVSGFYEHYWKPELAHVGVRQL